MKKHVFFYPHIIMKTKKIKKRGDKKYILIEKYEQNILGIITHLYVIHFNTAYQCKKNITIKNSRLKIKQLLFKKIGLDFLMENKISTIKLNKSDKNLFEKIKEIIDPVEKYTYCLNKDKLFLAETKTTANNSKIKNELSKHYILCDDTACASGEMILSKDALIFDNSSGTFTPTVKNLQILKKILPFLKIRIMNMTSKTHAAFYKDY